MSVAFLLFFTIYHHIGLFFLSLISYIKVTILYFVRFSCLLKHLIYVMVLMVLMQELKLDDILNMCKEYEKQIEEEQKVALSLR